MNKAEVLTHPVRMKISQALMRNRESGLSPLEMVKAIQDVPQATLYRHINVLRKAGIIRVLKEKKVRSVSQKYYVLNEEAARLHADEWNKITKEQKLNYFSYYQLSLMTQYQHYLASLDKNEHTEDRSAFSLMELKMDEKQFEDFQQELNTLMIKYYERTNETANVPARTIAVTIIPEA